ncbi:Stk1 family PASTA domain-containing Ser/Thr kinase [Lacticaseibacillus sharpeae]|uniref:non-specific serine/threonine protein kinase n=1 Tax=Lacticaseibacillus sharpeae JCM 1186 = DSM 20505 TaxID=1291052 RepID=A0A0R1ZMN1_9LACO|nr:Stk1 family PASTA domain-containing Ser/Thr kinase [Lacticaseibacillus sharpeae]KRM56344.1 serine threonine protein kinase [Lacticaseibacillus sharpeae JCM 1186 = DSM 20505]
MIEPGSILDERYQLTQTLGEGGMANVYLAHDLILDRDVAVKVLRLDLQNDPDTLRRFRREAMATLELSHPNIVNIYDVGESNGQQYLVMEYVKGTDLKKYIALNFPIPYARVIALMTQILSAVQTAHDHHIIHRDLKPQNILVDENGTAKITDFGIAVALSDNSMTQTNSLLGSVHYLSPEQARGSMPTRQSDIYALGIILYEMLTGTVPFEGESAVSIALKHFQQDVPSVRDFDPRIPQALENVVLKATAKEPAQRYTSASAMSADLATSLDESRAGEAPFRPNADVDMDATKVITPVTDAAFNAKPVTTPHAEEEQEEKRKPQMPKKRRWRKRYTAMLILAAVLVAAGVVLAIIWPNGDVNVPNVVGMTQTAATQTLEDKKLNVGDVTKKHSSKYKKGKVIATTPTAGLSVKTDSKVDLVVSSGLKKYTVGDYTDKVYADVAADLKGKGFKVKKRTVRMKNGFSGQILSQSIDPGTKVNPKKTTITLTVAKLSDTDNGEGVSTNGNHSDAQPESSHAEESTSSETADSSSSPKPADESSKASSSVSSSVSSKAESSSAPVASSSSADSDQ